MKILALSGALRRASHNTAPVPEGVDVDVRMLHGSSFHDAHVDAEGKPVDGKLRGPLQPFVRGLAAFVRERT